MIHFIWIINYLQQLSLLSLSTNNIEAAVYAMNVKWNFIDFCIEILRVKEDQAPRISNINFNIYYLRYIFSTYNVISKNSL